MYCAAGFAMVITLLLLVVVFSSYFASENFATQAEKKSAISSFFKKCGANCKYTDYRKEISPDVVEYLENNRKYRSGSSS